MKEGKKVLLFHWHTDKGIYLVNELKNAGHIMIGHNKGSNYNVEGYLGPEEIKQYFNEIPSLDKLDVAILDSEISTEYPGGYKGLIKKIRNEYNDIRIITLSGSLVQDDSISNLTDKVYCRSIPSDEGITQLLAMIQN